MTTSRTDELFNELFAQHDELRTIIDRCEALAADLDRGALEPAALLAEVGKLRSALDSHNRFEERLLQPILRNQSTLDAHIGEHRDVGRRLGGGPITDELYATLSRLREHLESEERYFERFLAGSVLAFGPQP